MEYLHRVADDHLRDRLQAMGAVLIEGPKWCGKTTIATSRNIREIPEFLNFPNENPTTSRTKTS